MELPIILDITGPGRQVVHARTGAPLPGRQAFEAVGGFPDQPLMEDITLSQRLRTLSRPLCLSEWVVTSGRRWEAGGVWSTIFLMWRLRWAYWRGVPASELAKAYR